MQYICCTSCCTWSHAPWRVCARARLPHYPLSSYRRMDIVTSTSAHRRPSHRHRHIDISTSSTVASTSSTVASTSSTVTSTSSHRHRHIARPPGPPYLLTWDVSGMTHVGRGCSVWYIRWWWALHCCVNSLRVLCIPWVWGVPCTPCYVVFVHVKPFCSQLATEHCWATLSLLYPTSEHILAVDFITLISAGPAHMTCWWHPQEIVQTVERSRLPNSGVESCGIPLQANVYNRVCCLHFCGWCRKRQLSFIPCLIF